MRRVRYLLRKYRLKLAAFCSDPFQPRKFAELSDLADHVRRKCR